MPEQLTIGARNPRAVAEIVLGRPVDWSAVPDQRQLLSDVLATPYEELFDPSHESPVFLGVDVDDQGRTQLAKPPFLDAASAVRANDVEKVPSADLTQIRTAADLKAVTGVALKDIPVRSVVPAASGGWTVELGQAPALRRQDLAVKFSSQVIDALWSLSVVATGWNPPGGEWSDVGSFFSEAAEYFDPVQAGLADCWLVSAMSSVAWAMPFSIVQRTRATGAADSSFVNLIELTDPASHAVSRYEMTDQTVVYSGTTSPMYSHSSEPGELWPQIIEKAYANLRAGTDSDHPDLTALNYGDCVHASAVLTGRTPHYTGTAGSTTAALLDLVKAHSVDHRTVDPMTCWTYGSGAESPDHVDYSSANVVANHCYSVLGWVRGSQVLRPKLSDRVSDQLPHTVLAGGAPTIAAQTTLDLAPSALTALLGQDFLVLRNPWGWFEATRGELAGLIQMKDVSFWRSIDLDVDDGVFAIDVPTFKKYFAGIGVAL
jgi:calpain family cysteine protease